MEISFISVYVTIHKVHLMYVFLCASVSVSVSVSVCLCLSVCLSVSQITERENMNDTLRMSPLSNSTLCACCEKLNFGTRLLAHYNKLLERIKR